MISLMGGSTRNFFASDMIKFKHFYLYLLSFLLKYI